MENKYKFYHEMDWFDQKAMTKHSTEFSEDYYETLLEEFTCFLKAVGLNPEGVLTFVDYDDTYVRKKTCDTCLQEMLISSLGNRMEAKLNDIKDLNSIREEIKRLDREYGDKKKKLEGLGNE